MRRFSLIILAVGSVALSACTGGSDAKGDVLMLAGQSFSPETLEVKAGDTVVFANDSSESHTVTAYEDKIPQDAEYFASGGAPSEEAARDSLSDGLLREGDIYEVTFDVPGSYSYFCIPHLGSGMVGDIVVSEG